MWLPIGTFCLSFPRFFGGWNGTVSYSFHQACQSCFSYSKWRKRTCSRPKRTPNSSEKRQGFWGVWVVLGLASIGHVDLTCQHVQSDVWEACRGELLKLEVVITNPVDLYIYVYIIWGCLLQTCNNWVVVSNIFHVHPYLGKIPNLTNIFQRGWNHQPMYGGCYELNHAYVSPLRLKGSNSELQHHHSLWSSAPLSASPKGFCIYIYIFMTI